MIDEGRRGMAMLPTSPLAFILATVRLRLVSAASITTARSELGTVATPDGVTLSCTVVATLAAPIGTTVSDRSSRFAVIANSPESGSAD
jgi:hypothetical protein